MFPKTFRVSDIYYNGVMVEDRSRPAYENARLPISVRQRGLMYWAVSANRRPDLIWLTATAHTMSVEYVGHGPVWIECIVVHNLKFTRRSTGNQWSCLRAGVTCSFIRRSRISRAAALWTRWSGTIADFGRLVSRASCRPAGGLLATLKLNAFNYRWRYVSISYLYCSLHSPRWVVSLSPNNGWRSLT